MIRPVKRYVPICEEKGCTWQQEYLTRDSAKADLENHLREWHGKPSLP